MRQIKILIISAMLLVIFTGCSKQAIENVDSNVAEKTSETKVLEETAKPEPEVKAEPEVDYSKFKVNENGKIMVLMYHGIGAEEAEWVRTVENFKKDLQTLYDKGYRTISIHDFINNNISTELGYTPVVITFDDGLQNQFNMIEKDGKFQTDPNSAVGIMKEFANKYKEFGNAATFYVYYPIPFRQKDLIKEKFEYLINNGFDIGNHSYTHEALGKMDNVGIQKQLGLNVKLSNDYLPGYTVDTLALPYGSRPKDESLRKYLVSGEHEGVKYTNEAVFLVGSNPSPSPNSIDFDPTAIPRIRASEMKTQGTGIYDWLNYFDKNPGQRYISDGNPNTIVVPKANVSKINMDKIKNKKIIAY